MSKYLRFVAATQLLFWLVNRPITIQAQTISEGINTCRQTRLHSFGSLPQKNARILYPGDPSIDITYYKLDLDITYTPAYLRGAATVGLKSKHNGLNRFFLDLNDSLRVDSIKVSSQKLSFSRLPNQLQIIPTQALTNEQALTVTIYYQGRPGSAISFATHGRQQTPIIWSLSEPYGARDWFPCKDTPADKADSSDVWITAPKQFVSISNGQLERIIDNSNNTRTYRWRNRYPIANYLISLAMTNYILYEQTFRPTSNDSMPVTHYIYPETLTDPIRRNLDETIQMLNVFTEYFGPYPFLKEKYGHAQFGWGGGMEHQTISSMGTFNPNVIAHELAHQWFGDKITCRSWEHIWLNEGFASYAEALYREAVDGQLAYKNYINNFLSRAQLAQGTLFVQDISNANAIFNSSRTYAKGAAVLHMLRGVVGEQTFKQILQTYANSSLAYNSATTEDFAAIATQVHGQSLDYFFKEWIYGEGFPTYQATWTSRPTRTDSWVVQLHLEQRTGTTNPTFFTMPVPIRVTTTAGDTTLTVFNNQAKQVVELVVKTKPTGIEIDPENWILKQVDDISVVTAIEDPVPITQLKVTPNPASSPLTMTMQVTRAFTGRLSLLNLQGQEVAALPNRSFEIGTQLFYWPISALPPGWYTLQVIDGPRRLTKSILVNR